MTFWKKNLVPALWALGAVAWLVSGLIVPVGKGEPLNYTFLTFAFMFFTFAVVFFGRKSGGGPGPPSA